MKTDFCYRTESHDYRPEWMKQGLPVPTPEQIQKAAEVYKKAGDRIRVHNNEVD